MSAGSHRGMAPSGMLLLALLCGTAAHAQGSGGGPASQDRPVSSLMRPSEGLIAISVIVPREVKDVYLLAHKGDERDAVIFADDGSLKFDIPGDGEFWAVVPPSLRQTSVSIGGKLDGSGVLHKELISVPSAWRSETYPVTIIATRGAEGWVFTRALMGAQPPPSNATGAGLSSQAGEVGFSAAVVYLLWGGLILIFGLMASIRSAVVRAAQVPAPTATSESR